MRKTRLIIALAALVLIASVFAHVGLSTMVTQLKGVSVALPIVMALSALRLLLQSTTWSASLESENVAVNRTTRIGVRLASKSMGYLTVLGPVISEPMKIKLLGTFSEPAAALFAISGIVCFPLITPHGAACHWMPVILAPAFAAFAITRRSPIFAGVVLAFGRCAPF